MTLFFVTCEHVLDPLFAQWLPLYVVAKLLCIVWLLHPHSLGAYVLFVTKLHPWITEHVNLLPSSVQSTLALPAHQLSSNVAVME